MHVFKVMSEDSC